MSSKQVTPRSHVLCFTGVLLSLLIPLSDVHAVEFGPLKGQGVLGKSLSVQAGIAGLDESSQEQLRATCMQASFRGSSSSVGAAGRTVPMSVDFALVSKGRGLIRLKSSERLLDPVGEVRLVSECPLAVFDVSWPILLDPATEPERLYVTAVGGQQGSNQDEFSFSASSALAQTFRNNPVQGVQPSSDTPRQRTTPVKTVEPVRTAPAPVEGAVPKMSAPEPVPVSPPTAANPALPERLDELAMLDQRLLDGNLIESAPGRNPLNDASLHKVSPQKPANSIQIDQIPVVIGSTIALAMVLLLSFWYLKNKRGNSFAIEKQFINKSKDLVNNKTLLEPSLANAGTAPDPEELATEHVGDKLNEGYSDVSNPLLMGSFLGADQPPVDQVDDSPQPLQTVQGVQGGYQQSLASALGVVNRADARPWALPAAYQSLVEDRNKVLSWSADAKARLLRCEVGLVELAFQEAKRGRSLEQATMLEFAHTMLQGIETGESLNSPEHVTEIVKSYLSAKFCEVSGSQAKGLLKGNCLALAHLADQYPVCFSADEWTNWVDESSVGV